MIVCLPAVALYMYRVGAWGKRTAWIFGVLAAFLLLGIFAPDEDVTPATQADAAPAVATHPPARHDSDAPEPQPAVPSTRIVSDPTCADFIRMSPADRTTYYDGSESTATAVLFGCNTLAEQDLDALSSTSLAALEP